MSSVRIRGKWALSLLEQRPAPIEGATPIGLTGGLNIIHADRARVHGVIRLGKEETEVAGRVKPGNPGIVVLTECKDNQLLKDGLELLLYIPPFWPTIDYTFDAVIGIMTISANSMIRDEVLRGKPFSLTATKAWPPVVEGAQSLGGDTENQAG
ncbi:hypothetical protein [Bradyrhizobium sp. CCH5-F6]|uniref:hypothetical protein n=1 Tax=Bradyrhizobium sp. CCH5-F6 TaxID=1768753 RepID=UPI00076ADCB3|nr:hypothetical protein [Bradyrhizobium sp. CCH5-F6]